jgi:hypothetical protein
MDPKKKYTILLIAWYKTQHDEIIEGYEYYCLNGT